MSDLYNPFDAIYTNTERLRQLSANQAAGRQYAAGNYQGAANALATSGDLQGAQRITSGQQEQELHAAQMANYQSEADARNLTAQQQFIAANAPRFKSAYDTAEQQKPGSGQAVLQNLYGNYLAPGLKARGVKDDELQRYGQLASDPNAFFNTLGNIAQEKVDWSVVGGELIGHTSSGKIVQRTKAGRIVTLKDANGETTGWLDPEAAGQGAAAAPVAPADGPVPAGDFDAFKAAIRGQEAPAGQAGVGVAGPPTQYGQAHGQMQVLDSTGEATARKLGVAWRPDLMRGTSPDAAAYQDQIGTAVAQDAWQQAKGDPATAAALYFAGPNHALWGPKTRQYQKDIIGRMGAPAAPTEQASANVAAPPGFTPLVHTAAPPPKPAAAPSGFQWAPDRKSLTPIPGGPADTQDETASFSPAAIDVMADTYLSNGGKMPSVGMGKAGAAARILVMNRVAEKMAARGETVGGVNARGASLKADSASLAQMTKTKEMVNAAEDTALKAANFVVQGMAGGGGTRFPLINKAIIAGRRATGDPQADVYVNRLGTFVDEYSKVIGGGTGSAAPTDSVRKEASRRISEASSPEQLRGVLDSMKQEMQFRSASLEDHVGQIQARINGAGLTAGRQRGWTKALTPEQRSAVQPFLGRGTTNIGSRANPRVPTNAAEYNGVPAGQWFIDTDGQIVQKGAH